MSSKTYILALDIDAESYLRLYTGQVRDVVARTSTGQNIRFPAAALRRFVVHDGIRGIFEIEVTAENRLIELRRKDG